MNLCLCCGVYKGACGTYHPSSTYEAEKGIGACYSAARGGAWASASAKTLKSEPLPFYATALGCSSCGPLRLSACALTCPHPPSALAERHRFAPSRLPAALDLLSDAYSQTAISTIFTQPMRFIMWSLPLRVGLCVFFVVHHLDHRCRTVSPLSGRCNFSYELYSFTYTRISPAYASPIRFLNSSIDHCCADCLASLSVSLQYLA